MQTSDDADSGATKIAILLPNPCNPDFRVTKQAESFARAGYDVRVFCRGATGLPPEEIVNGVTYIRKPITGPDFVNRFVQSLLHKLRLGGQTPKEKLKAARSENAEQIERLDL